MESDRYGRVKMGRIHLHSGYDQTLKKLLIGDSQSTTITFVDDVTNPDNSCWSNLCCFSFRLRYL